MSFTFMNLRKQKDTELGRKGEGSLRLHGISAMSLTEDWLVLNL